MPKHIYIGPMIAGGCQVCGKPGFERCEHFFNACSEPCDNGNGPCACGSWHAPDDFNPATTAENILKNCGPV